MANYKRYINFNFLDNYRPGPHESMLEKVSRVKMNMNTEAKMKINLVKAVTLLTLLTFKLILSRKRGNGQSDQLSVTSTFSEREMVPHSSIQKQSVSQQNQRLRPPKDCSRLHRDISCLLAAAMASS